MATPTEPISSPGGFPARRWSTHIDSRFNSYGSPRAQALEISLERGSSQSSGRHHHRLRVTFCTPKLALHSSKAGGLSILNRLGLLLDGELSTLWTEFLPLMQRAHTTSWTSLPSRRHRQGFAALLAHQGRLRAPLKALNATAPSFAPTSVWSKVS